jgi:hypothetical protein
VYQEEDEEGKYKSKHNYIKRKMMKEDRKGSMCVSRGR